MKGGKEGVGRGEGSVRGTSRGRQTQPERQVGSDRAQRYFGKWSWERWRRAGGGGWAIISGPAASGTRRTAQRALQRRRSARPPSGAPSDRSGPRPRSAADARVHAGQMRAHSTIVQYSTVRTVIHSSTKERPSRDSTDDSPNKWAIIARD